MKRKIFFILDRLQIKRSERITITVLMVFVMILTSAWFFITPEPDYSEEQYRELERIFTERSTVIHQEEQEILIRYQPYADHEISEMIEINSNPEQAAPDTVNVNINTADSEELQKLPGIGPAYAERIIAWREENGKFTSKDQLLEIRGIGPARLENMRHLIEL